MINTTIPTATFTIDPAILRNSSSRINSGSTSSKPRIGAAHGIVRVTGSPVPATFLGRDRSTWTAALHAPPAALAAT